MNNIFEYQEEIIRRNLIRQRRENTAQNKIYCLFEDPEMTTIDFPNSPSFPENFADPNMSEEQSAKLAELFRKMMGNL